MRGGRDREKGERGGGREWERMAVCKDFLCIGSLFLQRAFCCQEACSALWVFFPAIIFIFYLKGSQSWLPLKQDLEKTECPRVEV